MNVEEILAELVAIDSTSSRSNVEIVTHLAGRAEGLGLCARLFPYTDERGVKKLQLVAVHPKTFEDGGEVELALVGHTDTVPFDPAWAEALTLTEREGRLYGRGACDTKGFIAAALAALEEVGVERLTRPLALVLTADEEVGCLGAKHLAEAKPFRARHAVVGEPTSLQPMRAGKGYCLAEVTVRGREGHSAYPALGASAIMRAARLVTRIEAIAEELKELSHEAFDPPHTTLNVGLIRGGTAKNVIAGECRFTLEWRPVPGQRPELVADLVRREVERLREQDKDFDCEVSVTRLDGGAETPETAPLVKALEELTGQSAGTISFGTEAPQLTELGADAVVFGPGNIRVAHRTGEFVPVAELRECARILRRTVERFCGSEHQ
jgi:acetylornithine deacetylase